MVFNDMAKKELRLATFSLGPFTKKITTLSIEIRQWNEKDKTILPVFQDSFNAFGAKSSGKGSYMSYKWMTVTSEDN